MRTLKAVSDMTSEFENLNFDIIASVLELLSGCGGPSQTTRRCRSGSLEGLRDAYYGNELLRKDDSGCGAGVRCRPPTASFVQPQSQLCTSTGEASSAYVMLLKEPLIKRSKSECVSNFK